MITYIGPLFVNYVYIYRTFIYRGSLFSIFTTLIYHKVLINNKTEQNTEQDTTYRYDKRSRMPTPVALSICLFYILQEVPCTLWLFVAAVKLKHHP